MTDKTSNTTEPFISRTLDELACEQLKENPSLRSVFQVSTCIEIYTGDVSLGEEINDTTFVDEEVHQILEDKVAEVSIPEGYILVGVGDKGTADNPRYGFVRTGDTTWSLV